MQEKPANPMIFTLLGTGLLEGPGKGVAAMCEIWEEVLQEGMEKGLEKGRTEEQLSSIKLAAEGIPGGYFDMEKVIKITCTASQEAGYG